MTTLPKEIDYSKKLAALPSNTSCFSAVVSPSNGQSFFDSGSIIQFDLPSRGYLVPGSMYLRYKMNVTATAAGTAASFMKGTPFYTPIQRLETIVGSQIIESIQQYNQLAHMVVNTKMNHSQKAGLAYSLGMVDNTTTITYDNLNGHAIPALAANATNSWTMAGPLGCILSNADHLVPLCKMPSCRIQLTTETIGNAFTTAAVPALFFMNNMELCFDLVDFGSEVDAMVDSMADENGNIYIKSQSYTSSAQTVATGTASNIELVYNQRLSSIKAVIANLGRTTAASNTFLDSVDITQNNGDYQFLIASQPYPPRPLSTTNNKAGVLMELAQIWGPSHDMTSTNFSITNKEFGCISSATGNATTYAIPGKFWVGVNTERLSTNGNLLTGVSSQLSPISLRVNLGTATAETHTATLICIYDALIEINVASRQVSVKQ